MRTRGADVLSPPDIGLLVLRRAIVFYSVRVKRRILRARVHRGPIWHGAVKENMDTPEGMRSADKCGTRPTPA